MMGHWTKSVLSDPARFYWYFALFWGIIYALLIPPFQSPDEYNHFFRAWQVSEGHFLPEKTTDMRLGGSIPKSLDSLRRAFVYLKNDYAAKTTFAAIGRQSNTALEANHQTFIDFPNTAIYAPTAYLPQALAIGVLRWGKLPPIWMLYAGRLLNLLCWALLLRSAIRMMPFQRWLWAYFALLPAALVIAASLNADVVTNGLCCWTIAYFVQQAVAREALPTRYFYFAALALAVIGINKIVFAPLFLLQLLHYSPNMPNKRQFWQRFSALASITMVAAIGWAILSNQYFIPFDQYHPAHRSTQTLNEGVHPNAQIAFVLTHPGAFLAICARSYTSALPSTAAHLVGKFGWEKNYVPSGMMVLLWGCLLCLLFSESNPLRPRARALALVSAVICIAAFSVTMYALWCPVGSPILHNLQGRYFVPILPVLFLFFGGAWGASFLSRALPVTLFILLLSQIALLAATYSRYFF